MYLFVIEHMKNMNLFFLTLQVDKDFYRGTAVGYGILKPVKDTEVVSLFSCNQRCIMKWERPCRPVIIYSVLKYRPSAPGLGYSCSVLRLENVWWLWVKDTNNPKLLFCKMIKQSVTVTRKQSSGQSAAVELNRMHYHIHYVYCLCTHVHINIPQL